MVWLGDSLYFRTLAVICCIAIAPGEIALYGQSPQQSQPPGSQQEQLMNPQQLESLVAPVALYPDPLLAQVLAASTYPLEIVTAARWVQQNSNLKGKELMQAAGKQDWDPSVQALVVFPTVLQMMNQNVEWTTALGNAFLAQQGDVMAAVQRMRMQAEQSGKLQSNPQQQVQNTTVDGQPTIVIQPANPEVIYVPTYDPAMVFGAAPAYYPYPAFAYPTGAVVAASAISFGVGVAVGAFFNGGWGWGSNWGAHPSIYVNNNFFNHNGNTFVNRGNWGNSYRGNGQVGWNHNPRYRGAVPYANRDVANRFNGGRGGMRPVQLPSNISNIRPPSAQGGANRVGNISGGGPAGRGGPSQLPVNPGVTRPGGPAIGGHPQSPSVGSANRLGSRGGATMGAGGSRGGGGFRGGGFQGGGRRR